MSANTKYKNSVFSLLFSRPETLRELYGAISGVEVPADVPITINTLEDVLFMDSINDLSFSIGDKIVVLIEHQSTINPNMPLRLLLYIARVYEKITGSDNLYTSSEVPIPRPEFIVLYNGIEPYPDQAALKLSDAFADKTVLPELELTVKVFNINEGRNADMLKRSETLHGYAAFVGKVRGFVVETGSLAKAMPQAIDWCIRHGILSDFLETNGSEVRNMLLTEWNWDDALRVREQDGVKKGLEEVARNALAEGMPVNMIRKITGLDTQTITQLAGR
jgi:hypothetical protein